MPKISYKKPSLDSDPNSIFGTSKMILKEYQKGYEKDPSQPPIAVSSKVGMEQGKLNTKTEGVFGEYNLLIKNLTNSINSGTYYLETLGKKNVGIETEGSGRLFPKPLVDASSGFSKLIFPKGLGHGGKIDPNSVGISAMFRPPNGRTGNKNFGQNLDQGFKDVMPVFEKGAELFGLGLSGGVKYTDFNNKEEAEAYLLNKYAKQKGNKLVPKQKNLVVSSNDLKTARHFGIYNPVGRQSDNPTILIRKLTIPDYPPPPIPQKETELQAIEKEDPELQELEELEEELQKYTNTPPDTLEDEIEIEGDRFTEHPTWNVGVHGGDPYEKEGDSGSDEEREAEEEFPNFPPPPIHAYETIEGEFGDLPSDTRDDIINFYNNDEEPDHPEDTENMINNIYTNVVNRAKSSQIGENYIITLFNSINNQINKAMEYWESEISPVFTKISKIKVDSFVKGKTMSDFEKSLEDFENEVQKQEIYNLLPDFIDKMAVSISENATELFDIMNKDIKKFASGLMNEGDTISRTLNGGYVQLLKSPYGNLQHCPNKNFL